MTDVLEISDPTTTMVVEIYDYDTNVVETSVVQPRDDVVVEITSYGERGARGETGLSGGSFEYNRSTPSLTWLIIHNLGYQPGGVVVTGQDGQQCDPIVTHLSSNVLQLTFVQAFTGTAYLS